MAGTIIPWIACFMFFGLIVAAILVEIRWLVNKGWATQGKATGFVIATDLIGLSTAGVVALTAFFAMFMMVMGPAGRGSEIPEWAYLAVTIGTIIFVPMVFILLKRLFLVIFKIGSGMALWRYSIVTSLLVLFLVLIPPPLFVYLVTTIWKL